MLKKLRLEAGLTQKQVADKVKVSQRVISKYEQGICKPKYRIAMELSGLFGVLLDENGELTDMKVETK